MDADGPALARLKAMLATFPAPAIVNLRNYLDDLILTDDEVERAHRVEPPRRVAVTRRWERIRCGKEGCRCAKPDGLHGPYLYEYWREKGRLKKRYVPKGRAGAGPPRA